MGFLLPPPLGTLSPSRPRESPPAFSLCAGLQLPLSSRPGVPQHCLAPPFLDGQRSGASMAKVADVSAGPFQSLQEAVGRVQAPLLLPSAGRSSGCHSWLESPGGGLGSWSVVLALALQFQAFLELVRVQLPCKAPHTTLLFSLFWLSVHGAVGVPGGGRGWGQVHLRLLQHGSHIQLLGTERGDRGEVTSGARPWAYPSPLRPTPRTSAPPSSNPSFFTNSLSPGHPTRQVALGHLMSSCQLPGLLVSTGLTPGPLFLQHICDSFWAPGQAEPRGI